MSIGFSTKREYQAILDTFSQYTRESNNYDTGEVDNDLVDVSKGKKKKKQAPQINISVPSADLPKYGVLYEEGDKFEYVLKNELLLQQAIEELKGKQIDFLLE